MGGQRGPSMFSWGGPQGKCQQGMLMGSTHHHRHSSRTCPWPILHLVYTNDLPLNPRIMLSLYRETQCFIIAAVSAGGECKDTSAEHFALFAEVTDGNQHSQVESDLLYL